MNSNEFLTNPKIGAKVQSCVRAGITDVEIISKILLRNGFNVSPRKIADIYQYELDMTDNEELAVVADVAFDMAASGKFPHMTQWWLRIKGGSHWAEKKDEDSPGEVKPLVIVMKGDVT